MEACGAAVIIIGAVWAFARFVWVLAVTHRPLPALAVLLDLLLAAGLLRLLGDRDWRTILTTGGDRGAPPAALHRLLQEKSAL